MVKLKWSYIRELGYDVNFWRAKSGLEVDFVLGRGEVAIEVKGSSRIETSNLRPLKVVIEEYHPKKTFVVCNEHRPRIHENIHIQPWCNFLIMLWNGLVIS